MGEVTELVVTVLSLGLHKELPGEEPWEGLETGGGEVMEGHSISLASGVANVDKEETLLSGCWRAVGIPLVGPDPSSGRLSERWKLSGIGLPEGCPTEGAGWW